MYALAGPAPSGLGPRVTRLRPGVRWSRVREDPDRRAGPACARAPTPQQLRRNFAGSGSAVHPGGALADYRRPGHGARQRIYGTPISDVAAAAGARGADLRLLAERGVEIFFTQVFRAQLLPRRHASGQHLRDSSTDPARPAATSLSISASSAR
ncbi:MAG: hypothetical protein U5K33_02185 [Halofilum sp. (in: g-proteobacteria)]|nr:hypothetical protein [Halofilum sp. (in: g-proteobacteria)]